ncbi:MAG: SDR family oxidoreductase [Chloroflexi bacterium]|nr:SDR family oxidoreductase [Chloroflexota bacterium]
MDLGLAGKVAIVTGGASNIGRGIVHRLAQEGASVMIADIDEKQAVKVADEANAFQGGGKSVPFKVDATSYDSVTNVVEQIVNDFARINILVNSVGYDEMYLFVETKPDLWDKLIGRNYRSTLNFTRAVAPHMIEKKAGRIVSIGSDAGRAGEAREAVYAGTKGAVIAFSKSLARETARYGITVNVVCPGVVAPRSAEEVSENSMWRGQISTVFTPEAQARAVSYYPLRRLGTPQDVADAVAFLVSERASFITGQTLSVSGGYTMM